MTFDHLIQRLFAQTPTMSMAWVVIVAYFMTDFLLRNTGSKASLSGTATDRNSTRFIVGTFATLTSSAELLSYFGIGQFMHLWLFWLSLGLMLIGLLLRIVSVRQLRAGYTRMLKVDEGQSLVTTGLYRYIRHPGYLGTLLVWLFFGPAIGNYLVFILSALLLPLTYAYRIRTEEQMMAGAFGNAYARYQQASWRLIPFVW